MGSKCDMNSVMNMTIYYCVGSVTDIVSVEALANSKKAAHSAQESVSQITLFVTIFSPITFLASFVTLIVHQHRCSAASAFGGRSK